MTNFPAPPNLDFDFQTILNSRGEKKLPNSAYKLDGTPSPYGFDIEINDFGVDESAMSLTFPFADGNHQDGVGDVLEIGTGSGPVGLDTVSRHIKNPCILFDHAKGGYTLPIAMAESPENKVYTVRCDPVAKVASVIAYFYQGKKSASETGFKSIDNSQEHAHALFCEQLFSMAAAKPRFLRSGSVGYQIRQAEEIPANYAKGLPKGLHLISTIMLEASLVVLPANADTVITKSLSADHPYKEWQEGIAQILSRGKLCGHDIAPVLIKSLSPYAPPKVAQLGYEGRKSVVSDLNKVCNTFKDIEGWGPDYGLLFWNEQKKEAWFVTGDGDDGDAVNEIVSRLEKVPGVEKVTAEAECNPPEMNNGWVKVWKRGQKAMSYLNEQTGGALVKPPSFGPKIDKEKVKALRKKYKSDYNIEGIHKPGFEAQREREGVVTIPNSKWKPGRGAVKGQKSLQVGDAVKIISGPKRGQTGIVESVRSVNSGGGCMVKLDKNGRVIGFADYEVDKKSLGEQGQKNHGFVGTSNAGIPGNGLDGNMLKEVETTSPYITNGAAPDEFWASMTDSQRYKALRKKYKKQLKSEHSSNLSANNTIGKSSKKNQNKNQKGVAGAVAGGAAGIEAGPAGIAEGAQVGSQVEDAVTGKSQKKSFPYYSLGHQHNGWWISTLDGGGGIGPFKTREEAQARMEKIEAKYQEEKRRKRELKGKKSAKAPGVIEEPSHKSISVKWRNKVVKGFAEVQLRFDMMGIDIDKQNAFLVEMMKEGFGTPAQGKYVSKEPPKLQSPLKQATFTFTIEPGNRQSEDDAVSSAIRTATQIAKRHGARYTGNIGKSIPNYSTKSLDNEGNMEDEEEKDLNDAEGDTEEKYSAQVLRHMHENALILLEEYDSFTEQLEHEEISGHLHEKLEDLVSEIETLEEMMEKHHPESEPLGEGTKDMEGDEEETPVEADSEEEEVPTPDEALEGMDTKDLQNKYIKALRKTFTKKHETSPGRGLGVENGHLPGHEENDDSGLKKGPKLGTTATSPSGKKKCASCGTENPKQPSYQSRGRGVGVEGDHLPGHEEYDNSGVRKAPGLATTAPGGKKEMDSENLGVEDSHVPGDEADHEEVDSGHVPEGVKGLQLHHQKCIEGAKGFLADASNEYNWDHEHRMKSYHWHKALEETGDDAFGGMDGKSFPAMDHNDHEAHLNEPGEKSADMPNDDNMDPMHGEFDDDFTDSKSLHPHHKCMMGASKFLKDMSDTFEYGDDHRHEAAQHHQNLDEMSKSFEAMDHNDHEANVTEPGEMGEKSLDEKALLKQQKELAELKKLLRIK